VNSATPHEPAPPAGRRVRRKLTIKPLFHQIDMLGVVHNAVYFLWFDEGRMAFALDILPLTEAFRLGVALVVVENQCSYLAPVHFGDELVLSTEHVVAPAYGSRFEFNHSLVNLRSRREVATGTSAMAAVDAKTRQVLREVPAPIWERYTQLR
jgi:YbgC/YbaW family acyl-CoA thioester hydrolase